MAYETTNPQHDLHVVDWHWHLAMSKRPIFASMHDQQRLISARNRYDRGDLNTRPNWDLP